MPEPNPQDEKVSTQEVNDPIRKSSEVYRRIFDNYTKGPQVEGLTDTEVSEALADEASVVIGVNVDREEIRMPVFCRIEHSGWYNPDFYRRIEVSDRLYFSALPGSVEGNEVAIVRELKEKYGGKEIVVFFDELEGSGRAEELEDLIRDAGGVAEEILLGPTGGYASITQFEGKALLRNREGVPPTEQQNFEDFVRVGQQEKFTDRSLPTRILTKPVHPEDEEQIWDFYEESFRELNKDHPLLQSFDRKGLLEMLNSKKSLAAVHVEDGKIVTLAFWSQLDECVWLDRKFYEGKYPLDCENGNIGHIPTIVTNKDYRGRDLTTAIIQQLVDVVVEAKVDQVVLGECNDLTVEIIPLLVEGFFNRPEGDMTLSWKPAGKYLYRAIRTTIPG